MPKIKVKNPNYKEGGEKWLDVTFYNNTSGGELEEAPNDGRDYVRRDSDWVVSRKIYDELGISKTRFESLLNSSYYIPTLRNVPNENTLIYVDGEYNVNFKVGDYCRVANPDNKYGYDFFRLYDIKDGLAVWSADEVEGDTVINGETVLISLASNQSFADSALIGATILVYDVNDDINLLETTWQGTEILLVVPENHMYTVMVGDVQGYKNPGIKTMEAVNGATRVLSMLYETMVLSIKFSSNDAANTSTATATVTYDSMTATVLSGQAIKIPYGARVNIECSKILYFKTPVILEFTANQPIKEISSEYITSYLVVNYTKNQSVGGTPTITVVTEGITRPYVANMICAPEEQVTINFGELEYYKTPAPITFTKGVNIETKQGDYLSESVIVTLNTSDSKAVTNQVITLTCSTDSSYSKTYTCTSTSTSGDSGFLFYIPYGYAYKLKANNFYSYAPMSNKSYTAGSTTRTVTLLYTPGNVTIYFYHLNSGLSTLMIGSTIIGSTTGSVHPSSNNWRYIEVPCGSRLLMTANSSHDSRAWLYAKGDVVTTDSRLRYGHVFVLNDQLWKDIDTPIWESITVACQGYNQPRAALYLGTVLGNNVVYAYFDDGYDGVSIYPNPTYYGNDYILSDSWSTDAVSYFGTKTDPSNASFPTNFGSYDNVGSLLPNYKYYTWYEENAANIMRSLYQYDSSIALHTAFISDSELYWHYYDLGNPWSNFYGIFLSMICNNHITNIDGSYLYYVYLAGNWVAEVNFYYNDSTGEYNTETSRIRRNTYSENLDLYYHVVNN